MKHQGELRLTDASNTIQSPSLWPSSKLPSIVFITDLWGYKRGGINVFNTDLCAAMAQLLPDDSVRVMTSTECNRRAAFRNATLGGFQ